MCELLKKNRKLLKNRKDVTIKRFLIGIADIPSTFDIFHFFVQFSFKFSYLF